MRGPALQGSGSKPRIQPEDLSDRRCLAGQPPFAGTDGVLDALLPPATLHGPLIWEFLLVPAFCIFGGSAKGFCECDG